MENLIDYLVPLIVILSFLSFKAKRKKAKEEDPDNPKKKSAGLFGKLNKLMEEYHESDLKGAPPSKGHDTDPWEDDPWEVNPAYAKAEPEEDREDEPEPQSVSEIEPEINKKPDKTAQPTVVVQIPSRQTSSEYLPKKVSKADLRKAVVWSEILGPPVALKEK